MTAAPAIIDEPIMTALAISSFAMSDPNTRFAVSLIKNIKMIMKINARINVIKIESKKFTNPFPSIFPPPL